MRKIIIVATAASLLLTGCSGGLVTKDQSTEITTVLTQVGNTLVSDLQGQRAVALAATPPDTDGAQCAGTPPVTIPATAAVPASTVPATGAMAVALAIQQVAAATANQPVGALTVAEIATLYQPGSDQFNWAVKTLETACIAKVHDVNQAVNSTDGVIAAIPQILALGAAPAGL
jgi:hypothetical protein